MTKQIIFENLVHIGALLYLVCFLFRDQMGLRAFAMMGDLVYTAYYFGVTDQPLWGAMFWSTMNMAINGYMIMHLLKDRREGVLGDDELRLYRNLSTLSPGEFRKLIQHGTWKTADEGQVLTEEGKALDKLYYVLEGKVFIDKSGRKIDASPSQFVGEIAYLKNRAASATVTLGKGTLYMTWSHEALAIAKKSHDNLGASLNALLNADMADKVARA